MGRTSNFAEERFRTSEIYSGRAHLFSGGKMKTVGEVIDSAQIDKRLLEDLIVNDIREHQSLTYFDHKVPDRVSFPITISRLLQKPGTEIPYRTLGLEPYKQPGTEYYKRSEQGFKGFR